MLADPLDIGRFEAGRIIPTAGGTFKAIYFTEGLFMQVGKLFQNPVFIGTLQEILVQFLVLSRLFLPIIQEVLCHL
jgi:hypothetical protein